MAATPPPASKPSPIPSASQSHKGGEPEVTPVKTSTGAGLDADPAAGAPWRLERKGVAKANGVSPGDAPIGAALSVALTAG
jgi:hypothetical protein